LNRCGQASRFGVDADRLGDVRASAGTPIDAPKSTTVSRGAGRSTACAVRGKGRGVRYISIFAGKNKGFGRRVKTN